MRDRRLETRDKRRERRDEIRDGRLERRRESWRVEERKSWEGTAGNRQSARVREQRR
jgi:hypothetical protein